MHLTSDQLDRVRGTVLGTAVGDALGAPYEFGSAQLGPDGPQMIGGGLGHFAPGEWTDDTSMAWAILDVAATGADLRTDAALTAIARNFHTWYATRPPDIGVQTRALLSTVGATPTAAELTTAAEEHHRHNARSAGNGSLMRTAPVALPYLDAPEALVRAARDVSRLTHADPQTLDGCVLWSLAIRHAVVTGELDIRSGLAFLDDEAAAFWAERLDEAETGPTDRFHPNGWVVTALQAAWAAIVHTPVPAAQPADHLQHALTAAIAIGDDTDTVAAIAGGLLGARYGASAVPQPWREICHGYPGLTADQLMDLAERAVLRTG